MKRIFVAISVFAATLFGAPSIAAASCIGPTITYTGGEVEVGGQVQVLGSGWGDNCYDTGPPPDGEGALGNPRMGIEVFAVQGDSEILLASGDADAAYEFVVNITIPSDLTSGKFEIIARDGPKAFVDASEPLVLLETDAVVEPTVASFEPSDVVFEQWDEPGLLPFNTGGRSRLIYAIGAGVLVLAALAASIRYTRR